jgi:hypothetical protein
MQIGVEGIENLLIIFIIYKYDVEKITISKRRISTPLRGDSKAKFILAGQNLLDPIVISPIPTLI